MSLVQVILWRAEARRPDRWPNVGSCTTDHDLAPSREKRKVIQCISISLLIAMHYVDDLIDGTSQPRKNKKQPECRRAKAILPLRRPRTCVVQSKIMFMLFHLHRIQSPFDRAYRKTDHVKISEGKCCCQMLMSRCSLKLPVLVDRLDGPVELLAQSFGKELLNGDVELLRKDDRKTRIDVILI